MSTKKELIVPDEFNKIITDFITDVRNTFPEYTGIIDKWWNRKEEEENKKKEIMFVFRHCTKIYPARFFDILYKKVEIFDEESDINTEFLPGIVFKHLWNLDISDNTKETIWKYLQLISFSVMSTVHDTNELGDSAKLFESVGEDELKKKLEETFEGFSNLFENTEDMSTLPNVTQMQEHLNTMIGGKLGKLALELAEETAKDFNLTDANGTPQDMFKTLFKNPSKLMSMAQKVGTKIDEKIKSGELKESEMMEEGMELMNKMKNMPGIDKMFSQMGMNMGAFNTQMKKSKIKEKLRNRATNNANNANNKTNTMDTTNNIKDEDIIKMFETKSVDKQKDKKKKTEIKKNKK